ncbi:MAG: hypothetical protein JWM00_408 [Candidatus Saccharibacteria bacterium]|nr:hypothetical protein [Candidatus Saccharibacteria bacterium]
MDTETEPVTSAQPTKHTRSNRKKTILLSLLVLLLVGAAAGTAYWWRDAAAKQQAADITSLQQKNTKLEKDLAAEKAKNIATGGTSEQTACTPKPPSAATIDNIKASITSGNTAALEGYMASSVNVIIAASEGLGQKTPTEAVLAVTDFITSDSTAWDYNFSLPDSTLSTYSNGGYAQYFPDSAVVGKAGNQKVISFSFDCNGKVSTVFLAAYANLLQ